MDLYFLQAAVPLTKTITPTAKLPYPQMKNFTSHKEVVNSPVEFFKAVEAHASLGHCLLKGQLARPLTNEPRAGTTRTDDLTQWICLDFDRFETPDIDDQLQAMGLADIAYVLQYSSSHGLPDTEGTISAHVFMLLDSPVHAPALKAWLMGQNLTLFRDELRLSRCKNQLSWPLDITTCQNDKLLYITPPVFKGMKDPLQHRIQIVTRPLLQLPADRIGERHIDALKNDARKALNELRIAEGLKARTAGTSWVGSTEVVNKPNVASVTGVKESGEFVRLNLNGGDSWAYWHPKDNFDLIFDYKSDTAFKTKELLPGYYADLAAQRSAENATPTEDGDLILAFRDLKSAEYYNGLWNPGEQRLELYRAKNETQLDHWMRSHGRFVGDFIPVWDIQYDPRAEWVVDEDKHLINTFTPSTYMRMDTDGAKPVSLEKQCPDILSVICHMLGERTRTELVDHFLNWFACIFQRQHKPLTAWVTHGIEGTGKGFFVNRIAMPLLGARNAISVTVGTIEDQFNGWLEGKLMVLIDEVDVDDFREKGRITAKLRNYITEPTMPLRRMRQQTIDVPNHVSFIFSSNRPQPVFIPPSDRRYNVGNYQAKKLPIPDEGAVRDQLEAFALWMIQHKADHKQADAIIHTPERERIKALSITSIVETCRAVTEGDLGALWLARADETLMAESGVINQHTIIAQSYNLLMKKFIREARENPHGTVTRDELLTILQYNVGSIPTSPNKFTSLLRHNGIETTRVRKNGQLTYGVAVEWVLPDWLEAELPQPVPAAKRATAPTPAAATKRAPKKARV